MKEFPLPTIHLNGNSKINLLAQYQAAEIALRDFCETFGRIEFHGRDYYVQDGEAFDRARAVRIEMAEKIADVAEYLDQHVSHIYKQ